jgi:Phasin protein
MPSLSEQLVEIGQTNLETMMRIASLSFDRTERLMKLQSEKASQVWEESTRSLDSGLNPKERGSDRLAEWSQIYPVNVKRAIDATRSYFEITIQTQSEISEMLNEQIDVFSKGVTQNLEQWARAINTGSEEAITAVQSMTERTKELTDRIREQAGEIASRDVEDVSEAVHKSKKTKGT